MRDMTIAGGSIIGGLAILRRIAPVSQTIRLARVDIAPDFFLGTAGHTDTQGGGPDHDQRDV